jgi:hypothetical protein
VFTDAMLTFTENTIRTACADLDAEPVEFNGEADHVHLLVAYPPTLAITVLAPGLKGRTAYAVRREFTGVCPRPPCAATSSRRPTSPSPVLLHRCRSSRNTSTDKPDHSERRGCCGPATHGMS